MIYLLDADTLIRADSTYYALKRFPVFWQWLRFHGAIGNVKIPLEQYEEVIVGTGVLVDWLKEEETSRSLILDEEVDPVLVAEVTARGYAQNLDDAEIEKIGRDPFLISYGCADIGNRCVVTFEVSAPSKQRANRKLPDVCRVFDVPCMTLFGLIHALDFTTEWRAP